MKLLVLFFAFLTSLFSFAATQSYQITTKFFVDGKLVSSPRITTLPGEAAEVSQHSDDSPDNIKIKVIATDLSNDKVKDGILMKFDIVYQNGARILKASPEILAASGSDADITIGDKKGEIQLKVTAIRL